jgi:hypothetical protein
MGNLSRQTDHAADLQWAASNPADAGTRDQFRLNTFPPAEPVTPTPVVPPGARTKARATRTVTDEFVRLNFRKRKAAFGNKDRFFHALKVLRKLA